MCHHSRVNFIFFSVHMYKHKMLFPCLLSWRMLFKLWELPSNKSNQGLSMTTTTHFVPLFIDRIFLLLKRCPSASILSTPTWCYQVLSFHSFLPFPLSFLSSSFIAYIEERSRRTRKAVIDEWEVWMFIQKALQVLLYTTLHWHLPPSIAHL